MINKRTLILFCILALVFCLSWSKSTDFTQDLGRHLKIGQIIMETGQIPQTNLFSYTHAGFSFLNHHWLTEVIFYLLVSSFGLGSLFILRSALLLGSTCIIFKSVKKQSHPLVTGMVMLLFLPLILERIDIRPELFGFFFTSLMVYVLFFQNNRLLHYAIPVIMVLWVNIHISFVFGLFLLTVGIISHRYNKRTLAVFISGILATLLNPHGIAGALAPFTIFQNYGYPIVENQNIFFINSVMVKPVLRYYLILSPVIISSVAVLLIKKQYSKACLASVFYLLGLWQIRHIPFFIFTSAPVIIEALEYIHADLTNISVPLRIKKLPLFPLFVAVVISMCAVIVSQLYYRTYDNKKMFGYGYDELLKEGTDFILRNDLPDNLFNNFDIGGYAIYRLYPKYPVFVDNRPEAYPADFLQDTVIRLQEDDIFRKKIFAKYRIRTVLFSHNDMTPWGRKFMANILNDPEWRMVFVNAQIFVMTDAKTLPDIRNDPVGMRKIIQSTYDSVDLLTFSSFLSNLNQGILAYESVEKARRINPFSCAIQKMDYERLFTDMPYQPGMINNRPWWCY